ncbi:hormogonium polysaccharide biosynthesis glycosyltransferase HpsN [Nodosilinea sp. P-1105]|uniref:hormogonium polysaccharide biosynthesis glycosyltransferase HpsN n=1 Tax=Nodosilinea sp. P-1105 TaxID=2546229 RepID=UPI00146D5693|nr:hormogonium polysaccharide biosynthesis glycosyltransferase HpsN [Nodosilinea sp. P-1105]NMF82187.1 glycosyltransferase [Nodosilinea sp. P-1105]
MDSLPWPTLTVIIPTYRREAVLCDTLASLLAQDYPAYEVIVVDQTPVHQASTQQQLMHWAQTGQITWYQVPWASLPAARNLGIEQSTGEIVLFIDDDVVLPAGYLYAHARSFLQQPQVGAVAGRVHDPSKLAEAPDLTIDYLPPEAMDPGVAWYHLDLVRPTQPQAVLTARGCNMSFRRQVFNQYGLRFDERFYGTAVREESDLCLRLRQTGYLVWYNPQAYLLHRGETTGGCHHIATQTLRYQLDFYHNHFLLGLKNLTCRQNRQLFWRLFTCHVLGHPPCNKDRHTGKVMIRGLCYGLGFLYVLYTLVTTLGKQGRLYPSQLVAASLGGESTLVKVSR